MEPGVADSKFSVSPVLKAGWYAMAYMQSFSTWQNSACMIHVVSDAAHVRLSHSAGHLLSFWQASEGILIVSIDPMSIWHNLPKGSANLKNGEVEEL